MALVICPRCGKEISDRAKKCPHCGLKLRNRNRNAVRNKSEIGENTAKNNNEINDGKNVAMQQPRTRKSFIKKAISVSLILLFISAVCLGLYGCFTTGNREKSLSDKEKIEQYIPQFFGRMDEYNTISTPVELMDMIEKFELFGMNGKIDTSFTEKGNEYRIADIVIWTSREKCSENQWKEINGELFELYGNSAYIGSDLRILDTTIKEYNYWTTDEYDFIVSGIDGSQKLKIIWFEHIEGDE